MGSCRLACGKLLPDQEPRPSRLCARSAAKSPSSNTWALLEYSEAWEPPDIAIRGQRYCRWEPPPTAVGATTDRPVSDAPSPCRTTTSWYPVHLLEAWLLAARSSAPVSQECVSALSGRSKQRKRTMARPGPSTAAPWQLRAESCPYGRVWLRIGWAAVRRMAVLSGCRQTEPVRPLALDAECG